MLLSAIITFQIVELEDHPQHHTDWQESELLGTTESTKLFYGAQTWERERWQFTQFTQSSLKVFFISTTGMEDFVIYRDRNYKMS